MILAAMLVMGVIYILSFTSIGTAPIRGEFPERWQGKGQLQVSPEGEEFEPLQEGGQGFGQGNGFGGGRHLGQDQGQGSGLGQGEGIGFGHGTGSGEEFSLERGLHEFMAHLIAVAIIVAIVYFFQYQAKRRHRVSPASQ